MGRPSDSRSLVLRADPELRLAPNLEQAGPSNLVHIDGKGEVRSPARYRALTALTYGITGAAAVAATVMYTEAFGPLGTVVGLLFVGTFGMGLARGRRMNLAAMLIQENRLDEAETLCRATLAGQIVPRRLRAAAHQNLSAIAARRGDFEPALSELRRAIQLRHSPFRRSVYLEVLAYVEIGLLVNLGRVGEARARLDSRGAVPDGNYLRVQHWTAELFVQFAEGRLEIDDDELWLRSQAALRITGAAQLLALCAWAFAQRGDEEMRRHLIEQAVERADPQVAIRLPTLWHWVSGTS